MVIGLLVKTNISSLMSWQVFLTIALLPTSMCLVKVHIESRAWRANLLSPLEFFSIFVYVYRFWFVWDYGRWL